MGFDSQFTHHIPVRYGELDQQGVVFNAHYLAFIDDAFEQWTHTFETDVRALGWDMMLKKLDMEWHSPAGYRDVIQFDCAITRWGGASFEITYVATVDERPIVTAVVLYVSVTVGENTPMRTPEEVKAAFGRAVEAPT